MKKFIIFLVAVMISCEVSCFAKTYLDTNLPLAGETLLPLDMHAVVLGFTYSRASHAVKGCRKLMLSDTKVTKEKEGIEYDRHGREIGGNWSEEWTIDACGTNVIVPINFTTKKKGVRYDIQPAKF